MDSSTFPIKSVQIGDGQESIARGGRGLFPLVRQALEKTKVHNIVVLGWGSQGPAQGPNFRDTLAEIGSPARIRVGLRAKSDSIEKAKTAGMEVIEMFAGIREADLVICLINDAGQIGQYRDILAAMKSGSTLGFSHGFLAGYLESIGEAVRSDINVIGVCPKGMGPSVRKLYLQGKNVGGAGINSSIAVEQDATGYTWDIALAWAIAIGSPTIFETTLGMEWRSDLTGERGILLGAVWGIVEAVFQHYLNNEINKEEAFRLTVESLTGPINTILSKSGMMGLYRSFDESDQQGFRGSYNRAYGPLRALIEEIYAEVDSGREIGHVIAATNRLQSSGQTMPEIDRTLMWTTGETVRSERDVSDYRVTPNLAGIYAAGIMAQVDVLRAHGHSWSEVVNESIIEAFASLIPFMHARGIAYMVDNCSITARLGTRVWGPRFEHAVRQQVLMPPKEGDVVPNHFVNFMGHTVHGALMDCMKYHSSVSIAVT